MDSIPAKFQKTARVALFGLDNATAEMFVDAFRQFGISAVSLNAAESRRLTNEKFDACVVRLDENAEAALQLVRGSRANYRMVIYAIGTDAPLRYSRYGINVVVPEPLDRRTVLRAVHSTRTLVLHEFRRYVRIPLVTEVNIEHEGRKIAANTQEISGGGMSLIPARKLALDTVVCLAFTLPHTPPVKLYGTVRWQLENGVTGVQFNENQPQQSTVKNWINDYLEL